MRLFRCTVSILVTAVVASHLQLPDAPLTADRPNYWGCMNDVARSFSYCNTSLAYSDRLEAFIGALTLEEKISLLSPDRFLPNQTCYTHTPGVPRVGLPSYLWLVETNTVVASACGIRCATTFAGPISMAASWNRTAWREKGRVLGVEQRAMMNVRHSRHAPDDARLGIGFTAFGPNMNLQRDPRFGRSSELPGGEDPFLVGQYAAEMVQGLQTKDASEPGYPLTLAYLKHYAVYNRETNRGHDSYEISKFDLFDSYLPAFLHAAQFATGAMCSYAGVNGRPSCANALLRSYLPLSLHVTSDCDAIRLLQGTPANAPDPRTAAIWALRNGTDLEMGSLLYSTYLEAAVQEGDVSEEQHVNAALRRSMAPHFAAGRFDPPTANAWSQLGWENIGSDAHGDIQLDIALQGIVLLKNEAQTLPISSQQRIAVLGPMAHTRAGLMSSYESDQTCHGGGHACVPTIAESIRSEHMGVTTNASGVDVDSPREEGIAEAMAIARAADVIVLCLGITKEQEREALDRNTTKLPGLQNMLAAKVFTIGVPVVLVLVHGGQVAIDHLVEPSAAIVDIFNPNTIGGVSLAKSLVGVENRWGKLPYTIYPESVMEAFDMEDHSMTATPGRTYRYFTGTPIFPFGYGLSYTTFSTMCSGAADNEALVVMLHCKIQNTGSQPGDEVLQVYHSAGEAIRERAQHPVPLSTLRSFERVHVDATSAGDPLPRVVTVDFRLEFDKTLVLVNERGVGIIYPGDHTLVVTNGVERLSTVTVHIAQQAQVTATL